MQQFELVPQEMDTRLPASLMKDCGLRRGLCEKAKGTVSIHKLEGALSRTILGIGDKNPAYPRMSIQDYPTPVTAMVWG